MLQCDYVVQAIANREVPIPDHLDMYHLHQEAEPSDRTALEAVVDHIREEMERLHAQVCSQAGSSDSSSSSSSSKRAGVPQAAASG
jgi:ATP-binding cassette subfamily F protein 2